MLIATLVLVGCGTGVGVAMSSSAKPGSPTVAHRQAARSAAEQLFSKLRLPAGAESVQSDESRSSLLGVALEQPASGRLVDLHRFWRMPGKPCKVRGWLERQPPAGSKITTLVGGPPKEPCKRLTLAGRKADIEGAIGKPPLPPAMGPYWGIRFSFPEVPGRLALRALTIKLAPAQGGGTALRADAQVIWTHPVSASEHIPSGVRSVLVKARDPGHHVHFKRIVRDQATVRRIVALVEHLKVAPPPTSNTIVCPLPEDAAVVAMSFRGAAHRRPLAHLKINENECPYVELQVHGQGERKLEGALETVGKLEKLLKHRL